MRHAGIQRVTWGRFRKFLGLPESVCLDGIAYDPVTQTIGFIVEGHPSLPQVPDGAVPPYVEAHFDEALKYEGFSGFAEPEPVHVDTLEAP